MLQLTLKRSSFSKLCCLCSLELIDYVFKSFTDYGGIINYDEENVKDDLWEIDGFYDDETFNTLDIMKVMSAFGENGQFLVNGKKMFFEGIVLTENHKYGQLVNRVWKNCKLNNQTPFFDLGVLDIPKIMPRYRYTKMSDICFTVEKFVNGNYIPTPIKFLTQKDCEDWIKEQNETK